MPEYTVEAIVEKRPWEGRNGTNVAYNMRLAGQDQIVEWSKAQDKPAPQLGEKIVGDLSAGFKDKLKFTPERTGGYGGGGGGGGGGRSSQENGRIIRQNVLGHSLRYHELREEPPTRESVVDVAETFEAWVKKAEA